LLGTLVIGAGAAGIAAARALRDAGRKAMVIEARDHIGGRARTWSHRDMRFDLGCGWLHSARRNPWTAIARSRGFTIATNAARWGEQWRDLGFSPRDRREFAAAYEAFETRARTAADGPDRPLSDFLDPADRWTERIEAISGYVNGASLAATSLHDWLAYDVAAGDEDWSVREGYGTVVTDHARDLDIRTGVAATRIDHRGRRLRVETSAGVIEADTILVTVPTTILAHQRLTFDPPLPDKHAAAAALPLGLADKVLLSVEGPEWEAEAHLTGAANDRRTGSYRLSPFGWPAIEGFFGGEGAATVERAGAAFAIDELVTLLGSAWRPRLHPLRVTRWSHEPWIGGSYSHARVGHADARAVLAAPVDGRLFFAGEACSATDFSTAHGAYETGVAAANAIRDSERAPGR
jgi:monoamine oxidase